MKYYEKLEIMLLAKELLHHPSNQNFYSKKLSHVFVHIVLLSIKVLGLRAKRKYYNHVITQIKNLEWEIVSAWTVLGSGSDG